MYVGPGTMRLRKIKCLDQGHTLIQAELQYNPRSV